MPYKKTSLFKRLICILVFLVSISAPHYAPAYPADIQTLNDSAYFKTVHSMFSKAQKSIYVIMYHATYYDKYPDSPSNNLIRILMDAAGRGVDVRIIMDRMKSKYKKSDKPTDNEIIAKMLSSAGVKVYLDSEKITTHAKLIIVDSGRVVVGSTNWSYPALTENNEANVIIDSPDLAKQYTKYFNELAALCTQVK